MALSRPRRFAINALLVALTLGIGASFVLAPEDDAMTRLTALTIVDGRVLVRHGDADFALARVGDVVAAGDTIRVGPGASAELTYFEGSSIRLDAETEMVVASLRTDRRAVIGMTQTLGRAWHVVTKLVNGDTRYGVRGPSATASVRG